MNILLAFDSFKGSFSAAEVCGIVARILSASCPDCQIRQLPLADGGEGTSEALVTAGNGQLIMVNDITGPLPSMRLDASYGWLPLQKTAVVEMARASGLPLLTMSERDPRKTTTFGTGELLRAAAAKGAEKILLALGGSATVDGGTGAAAALGWRFLDRDGDTVAAGGEHLCEIDRILAPNSDGIPLIQALCDVENPLCGSRGAAAVYGPQKGATTDMVRQLESGLFHLAEQIQQQLGKDVLNLPGAGAAGGFGAGAVAFFNAELVSGFQAVADVVGLDEALQKADCVITGEGKLDSQSLQGKVVAGVCACARKFAIPVGVIAGRIDLDDQECRDAGIRWAVPCTDPHVTEQEAFRHARHYLTQAVGKMLVHLHSLR